MLHKNYTTIDSTQEKLKEFFKEFEKDGPILVSTKEQTKGRGRMGKDWHFCKNSLAFSFSLQPSDILTLSSLEVGILLIKFFKQFYHQTLFLKWPNDLLTADGKKCGGILIENLNQYNLAVGVGINLGPAREALDQSEFQIPLSFVNISEFDEKDHQVSIPEKIYTFILGNRLSSEEIYSLWNDFCFHKNFEVTVESGDKKIKGKFIGIGKSGEALIESEGQRFPCFSGSLFFK